MTEQTNEKTDIDKSRDIISQLKEMGHYSKENIVKLGEFWLLLEGEMKQKKNAEAVEQLLNHQNAFNEALEAFVSDYEIECNRIENEAE